MRRGHLFYVGCLGVGLTEMVAFNQGLPQDQGVSRLDSWETGAIEHCRCRGPETSVPLAWVAAVRSAGCLRVAGERSEK